MHVQQYIKSVHTYPKTKNKTRYKHLKLLTFLMYNYLMLQHDFQQQSSLKPAAQYCFVFPPKKTTWLPTRNSTWHALVATALSNFSPGTIGPVDGLFFLRQTPTRSNCRMQSVVMRPARRLLTTAGSSVASAVGGRSTRRIATDSRESPNTPRLCLNLPVHYQAMRISLAHWV